MILRNGIDIPDIGFGTWNIPYGEVCERAVFEAIRAGYRHIDTAGAYGNERSVGLGVKAAIREGFIKDRSDVFITSKLWNTNRSYNKAFRGFDKSMRNLDLDYIDLYLIHWPANKMKYKNPDEVNATTWEALEELYTEGRVRAIGVSNFLPHHIEELKKSAKVLPMVNQIELHVGYMQEDVVEYNNNNGIVTEGYSPLGTGALLDNELLWEMAKKYQTSASNICISFLRKRGIIPLPKTTSPDRMSGNLRLIRIEDEDMDILYNFPYIGGHAHNPDEVDF
ncbi:aldo/keto reductase [Catonella massiliensis]|uniref:Aldo/keto reductase n=1 Tax=Catonella massiliensis TaxID=2799636 RepID=A0ABS1J218_9FIRM|nr:aldo/keto reductase [Catonella massiliensis]MBK5898205.1 aldo/keto reductase [Catonella massiliensis]